jgi:diguanylate cyclase (GGDEF)-like protein
VSEAELRYRAQTVGASMLPTYGLCAAVWLYCWLTPHEPHRLAIAALAVVASISMIVLNRLPLDRIVRTRWREVFFVGWSLSDIALIAVVVALDGGVRSPLTLAYLFPLLFTSLSYPPLSTAIVYGAALGSYALVGLGEEPARIFMGLASLGLAPFLGFLQAREHKRQRRELAHSARTDALTGLLNHTAFQDQLAAELEEAQSLALLALDIDRFKEVNDHRGHAAGDAALRAVAGALRSVVRPDDVCGRIGGDEFMLALPGAGPVAAERVAERLRLALSATPVTVSIGIAVFPEHAQLRDELMHHADAAVYTAKQRGRDRAATYAPRA